MNILEQIFDQGYATTEVDIANGKMKAVVRNLAAQDQLEIESEISELGGKSSAYVLHQYSLKILERTLLSINGKTINEVKERRERLGSLPTAVVDSLIREQNKLEKDIAESITPDGVDKTFFETGSTQEGSGQKPAASSSEEEGASGKQSS